MKNSYTKDKLEEENPKKDGLNDENAQVFLTCEAAEESEEKNTRKKTDKTGIKKKGKKSKKAGNSQNGISKTKALAGTGIFSALAFVVSFLEFSIFPTTGASFLKLDFSLVFVLLAGFIFGPISGFSAAAIKELLRFAAGSATGGVGEIANFIVTAAFIAVPTIVYRYKKGLPTVIVTLVIGSALEIAAALFANRFINFPLFMGDKAAESFAALWYFVLLFNFIKCVAVSLITVLLYKKVSFLVKKI